MTVYPSGQSHTLLLDSDRRMLEEGSAIAPDVIAESGARSIMRGSELPDVFSGRQRRRAPGVLFVSHRPNGDTSWCFRPRETRPDKPGHKYEQPCKARGGAGNVLDVLPSERHLIADRSVPVIFVEGTKKMLSVVSAARRAGETVLVVAIIGCWNWLHDGGKPIADMLDIPLEGRKVTVMFDSDMLRKVGVQGSTRRLAEYAQERGADAYVTYFEDAADGSKVGADDFFVAGGTFAELRILTRRYDPEDFVRVRLSRSGRLRGMLEDLHHRYATMPAAKIGECSDRASMRELLQRARQHGKLDERGIIVRAPSRSLAKHTRLSQPSQVKSLRRLERAGYLERIEEPPHKVEKHGTAYLLKASTITSGRAQSYQGREGGHQHNIRQEQREEGNPLSYADMYAGDNSARASEKVPELRHSKCIHTWGRREGRRVVVDSEYVYRLAKQRQEVVMYLLDNGGEATEDELLGRFGSPSTRMRDFRRRKLAPLMGWRYSRDKETRQEVRVETGPPIIELEADGTVRVLPEWAEALEEHRRATDEDGDTERQAAKYRQQSRKYHERREYERAGEGRGASDAREHPLRGKEHMRRVTAEREREDKQRWAEEQARKVGLTATTFLADEIDGEYGVRYRDAAERWHKLHGGSEEELRKAVRYGPFVFRKVAGDLFIDPSERLAGHSLVRHETAPANTSEARIARLVRQGMSPRWARAEVLGREPNEAGAA